VISKPFGQGLCISDGGFPKAVASTDFAAQTLGCSFRNGKCTIGWGGHLKLSRQSGDINLKARINSVPKAVA